MPANALLPVGTMSAIQDQYTLHLGLGEGEGAPKRHLELPYVWLPKLHGASLVVGQGTQAIPFRQLSRAEAKKRWMFATVGTRCLWLYHGSLAGKANERRGAAHIRGCDRN